jgi:hypothetical protein
MLTLVLMQQASSLTATHSFPNPLPISSASLLLSLTSVAAAHLHCRKVHPSYAWPSLTAAAARATPTLPVHRSLSLLQGRPSPAWPSLTAAAARAPTLHGCRSRPLPRGPPLPFLAVAHCRCRKGRGRANLISTGGERGPSSPQAASVELISTGRAQALEGSIAPTSSLWFLRDRCCRGGRPAPVSWPLREPPRPEWPKYAAWSIHGHGASMPLRVAVVMSCYRRHHAKQPRVAEWICNR